MRHCLAILAVVVCASQAIAQQQSSVLPPPATPLEAQATDLSGLETGVDNDQRALQLQAATSNGLAALREQVMRLHLTREINVREFVERTHSADALGDTLKAAKPAGGPRWVDDQTCQVRLEIPGRKVARFIQTVAHAQPEQSPVKSDVLTARFSQWSNLEFSAVGSSAGGDAIEYARPRTPGRWCEIGDTARRSAVEKAQADAVQQVVESINPISLDVHRKVKDAMARPMIARRVSGWLNRQPVTRIEFMDDLKVSVTISMSPHSLGHVLKWAVTQDAEFVRAGKAIDWDRVREAVAATPSVAVGLATATPANSALPEFVLPLQPPDWVDQQLEADATAHGERPSLKVGRAAEAEALDRIKARLLALHVDANTTLGDAARNDSQIAAAVARALRLARTTRVDYQSNGNVRAWVTLDLHDAWDEMRTNP